VIEAIEPLLMEVEGSGIPRSFMYFNLVELYGMTGRFEEAREAAALSRSIALDLGHVLEAAATSHASGPMERLNLEIETGAGRLRNLMQAGERRLPTTAGFLAHVPVIAADGRGANPDGAGGTELCRGRLPSWCPGDARALPCRKTRKRL
jgi:hypothetical protein